MAAARKDLDILWVLLLAVACGTAIWKHAEITSWMYDAWARRSWLR
jgi:hypothetical protein